MTATTASTAPRIRGRHAALGAAGLVALGLLVWWWVRASPSAEVGFVTEPADRGPVEVTVTATGTVNPVKTVTVGSYVSGPIQEIFVDYNSPVRQGQSVAKIDPRPFEVKVQQADANVANARARVAKSRADLELKRLNHERNRTLRGRNLIAQNDLDTARSDFDQARAQLALDQAAVQQAEAGLEEARINLGYTDITSPVNGVVVSRSVDVGQTVAASFQTPTLFLIAEDLAQMQVDANVSESDIGGVQPDQVASFSVDAYPGRAFEGRVVQVRNAPITVQNVVTYDVVIRVANPDLALKPGMTATVAIITAQVEDALRIPVRALRFRPDETQPESDEPGVWRLGAGDELERVPLGLGLRNDEHAEVKQGALATGDALVVARQRALDPDEPPPQSPFQPRRR